MHTMISRDGYDECIKCGIAIEHGVTRHSFTKCDSELADCKLGPTDEVRAHYVAPARWGFGYCFFCDTTNPEEK